MNKQKPEQKTKIVTYWSCDCGSHEHETYELADRCIKVGQYRDIGGKAFTSIAAMFNVSATVIQRIYNSRSQKGVFLCEAGHAHRSIDAKQKCDKASMLNYAEKTDRNDKIYSAFFVEGESKSSIARRFGLSAGRVDQILSKGLRISKREGFNGDPQKPYSTRRSIGETTR